MGFCLFNNWPWPLVYAQNHYPEIEASQLLTGTCITGTARRASSMMIRRYFFFRHINIRGIQAQVSGRKAEWAEAVGSTLNVPLRAFTPAREQKRIFDAALAEIGGRFKLI